MRYDAGVSKLLATMITTTSYGTWLPGDVRGFVERGVILGGNPKLLKYRRLIAVESGPVGTTNDSVSRSMN